MANKIFKITGMDCDACAKMIELDLEDAGIAAKCSYASQTLEVPEEVNHQKMKEVVENSGYTISPQTTS